MNGNDVQKIPSRMCKYFPKLRELKIDENRLSEISDRGFEDCAEITILTMRKNKLTEIKSNAVSTLALVPYFFQIDILLPIQPLFSSMDFMIFKFLFLMPI